MSEMQIESKRLSTLGRTMRHRAFDKRSEPFRKADTPKSSLCLNYSTFDESILFGSAEHALGMMIAACMNVLHHDDPTDYEQTILKERMREFDEKKASLRPENTEQLKAIIDKYGELLKTHKVTLSYLVYGKAA